LPLEYQMVNDIDNSSVAAVLGGGMLSLDLLQRIQCGHEAHAIISGYQSRAQSGNWAEWAKHNLALNKLLMWAMRLNNPDGE